jgi:hypothetical protein
MSWIIVTTTTVAGHALALLNADAVRSITPTTMGSATSYNISTTHAVLRVTSQELFRILPSIVPEDIAHTFIAAVETSNPNERAVVIST